MFRLLRVFKLAKIWPEFAYILATVGNTLKKISSFSVLLLIFIFSFAILGMELFGPGIGVYLGLACIIAYYCSGHKGIYASQRVEVGKFGGSRGES